MGLFFQFELNVADCQSVGAFEENLLTGTPWQKEKRWHGSPSRKVTLAVEVNYKRSCQKKKSQKAAIDSDLLKQGVPLGEPCVHQMAEGTEAWEALSGLPFFATDK